MKVSPVGHNSPLFCHIFGLNNALKALADPPHFSPEIGATETSKKSPEAAETMASLLLMVSGRLWIEPKLYSFNLYSTKTSIQFLHSVS